MSCFSGVTVVSSQAVRPGAPATEIVRQHCATCGRERYFIRREFQWQGFYDVCLGCGDGWSGGELLPRPVRRGWRQDAIRRAKERFRADRKFEKYSQKESGA